MYNIRVFLIVFSIVIYFPCSFSDGSIVPPLLGVYNNQLYDFAFPKGFPDFPNAQLDMIPVWTNIDKRIQDFVLKKVKSQDDINIYEFFIVETPESKSSMTYNIVTHNSFESIIHQNYKNLTGALNFNINLDIGIFTYPSKGIDKFLDTVQDKFKAFVVNKHDNIYYSPNNVRFTFKADRDFVFITVGVYINKEYTIKGVWGEKLDFKKPYLLIIHYLIDFNDKISSEINSAPDQTTYAKIIGKSLDSAQGDDKLALQEAMEILVPIAEKSAASQKSELENKILECLQKT